MIWQIYVSIAIIFWAVGQIFIRKGFKNSGVFDTFFMGGVFGFLVYLPYVFFHIDELEPNLFVFMFGCFIVFAYLIYYKALSVGNFSINNTIVSTFPLITILFAQIFLDEPLTLIQWLGVAIISLGVISLSYFEHGGFSFKELRKSHIKWPLIASIYIGFGDFLTKIMEGNYSGSNAFKSLINTLNNYDFSVLEYFGSIINTVSSNTYTHATIFFSLGLSQLVIGFILKMIKNKFRFNTTVFKMPWTMSGNLLLSAGTLFFYLALFSGWASLVVPISASHIILAVILARFFLHEKLDKKQYIVILFIVLGNVLVNW